MKTKRALSIILTVAALTFLLNLSPALAQKAEYKLQPTDILKITVHEQPDLTTKTRVTADGYITFPLLGKINVEALTVQELERTIKDLLEKDYLVNAQVLVFIEEYHPRQVSVIGEVNAPGKYDMPEEKDMTLLEIIAMAGGFTEDAKITDARIMRVKDGEKITIKVNVKDITEKGQKKKDIVLEADDIVFVPESFF